MEQSRSLVEQEVKIKWKYVLKFWVYLVGGNAVKPKIKRKDLMSKTDIWNAVNTVLSECDLSSEDKKINEAYIVHQYYSELESGGHKSLFTWFEWY
ncbi:hypothetical protein [Cytobacillus purgationiresistens]|uniref:Uncharacterized protein n=1 Tax=Cytobacillus purgationiresistens TaxID=863449 RepID=A0ABU0ARR6_9BACI|nr:hypothetical protein [Cytobacillus purgationiresistens]MDQ0273954.1 hypothetical protein [Cytobacillus purgationiresistens]